MKNNLPLVSIVLPVYNTEKYITESVQSILDQTYKNLEIIIVEDGSQDNTLKILQKFKNKDNRIKLVEHSKNYGLIKSLNDGLTFATGKYIARMDADDISKPERIQKQVEFLENNPDIYLVGTFAESIDEDGIYLRDIILDTGSDKVTSNLLKKITPLHPSIMFRNTGDVIYREKAIACEDVDMYLRLIEKNKKFDNLPMTLIKYRTLSNGISSSKYMIQKLLGDEFIRIHKTKVETGVDLYDELNVDKIVNKANSEIYEREVEKFNAMLQFNINRFNAFREKAQLYFKKYGIFDMMSLYYLCSFLPLNLINLLRRIV